VSGPVACPVPTGAIAALKTILSDHYRECPTCDEGLDKWSTGLVGFMLLCPNGKACVIRMLPAARAEHLRRADRNLAAVGERGAA
jgi:hypothetical protein